MDIPFLADDRFAVGKAEFTTGQVLNNNGTHYRSGSELNNMYEIFDSYIEAENFAKEKININPNLECWIVDSHGSHVITFDKNGERK